MTNTVSNLQRNRSPRARGFTVIELGVVLIIIVLLVSIVATAVRVAFLGARTAGEQAMFKSLRVGIEQFKQQNGFLPPLLNDLEGGSTGPLLVINGNKVPNAYQNSALSQFGSTPTKPRQVYSIYSLTYYLVGATDADVDGVDGPGYTAPLANGTFSKQGRTFPALFDPTANASRMARLQADPAVGTPIDASQFALPGTQAYQTFIVILDRWKFPVRYYRWEPTFYLQGRDTLPQGKNWGDIMNYNVPAFLGDPTTNADLRNARYAIVSGGPDGAIDDSATATPNSPLNKDNIVELGQ